MFYFPLYSFLMIFYHRLKSVGLTLNLISGFNPSYTSPAPTYTKLICRVSLKLHWSFPRICYRKIQTNLLGKPREFHHSCVILSKLSILFPPHYALLLAYILLGFPGGSDGKESPAIQETWVQTLGQEDSPGEGNGYPL